MDSFIIRCGLRGEYCKGKETGVILGCTEIGLLIQQNFMDVPIFDTTQIHAKKIAMYMIE